MVSQFFIRPKTPPAAQTARPEGMEMGLVFWGLGLQAKYFDSVVFFAFSVVQGTNFGARKLFIHDTKVIYRKWCKIYHSL